MVSMANSRTERLHILMPASISCHIVVSSRELNQQKTQPAKTIVAMASAWSQKYGMKVVAVLRHQPLLYKRVYQLVASLLDLPTVPFLIACSMQEKIKLLFSATACLPPLHLTTSNCFYSYKIMYMWSLHCNITCRPLWHSWTSSQGNLISAQLYKQ